MRLQVGNVRSIIMSKSNDRHSLSCEVNLLQQTTT